MTVLEGTLTGVKPGVLQRRGNGAGTPAASFTKPQPTRWAWPSPARPPRRNQLIEGRLASLSTELGTAITHWRHKLV